MRPDRIYWLLEIIERERHYELLLSVKNLQELGTSPFPYIVHALPRPLPSEVFKGEHFVLADLLKSLPEGSSLAEAALEPFVRLDHLPMAVQDPKPVAQVAKKKKKKENRVGKGCRCGIGGVCGLDKYRSSRVSLGEGG